MVSPHSRHVLIGRTILRDHRGIIRLLIHKHIMGESEHCTALGLHGSSRVQQSRGDSLTVLCHWDMGVGRRSLTMLDSSRPFQALEFDLFALL